MATRRFTTNTRLWLAVSLVLFVPPWFICELGNAGEPIRPAQLWVILFRGSHNVGAVIGGIVAFALVFGVVAMVGGWLIHCLIIILRDLFRRES
jgi:hypothetical protein